VEQLFMISSLVGSVRLADLQYTIGHKGYSYPSHRHSLFEFMYIVSGEIGEVVSERPHALRAGDSIVIKPGLFHHTPPISEKAEWFVFHFEVEDKTIHEILQTIRDPVIRKKNSDDIHDYVHAFINEYGFFLHQLGAFGENNSAASKYAAVRMLQVQSSILTLISLLSHHFHLQADNRGGSPEPPALQPSVLNLAHEAAYWIEKRAEENMKIGELAQQLNVDRSHLTSCFKKAYGLSPRHYLTQVRIRRAKELLTDTDWSMEKIAEELHFSSPSHFVKFFLHAVGVTPFKFRNRSKKG
jgi:AraC-like DNA-binding protein